MLREPVALSTFKLWDRVDPSTLAPVGIQATTTYDKPMLDPVLMASHQYRGRLSVCYEAGREGRFPFTRTLHKEIHIKGRFDEMTSKIPFTALCYSENEGKVFVIGLVKTGPDSTYVTEDHSYTGEAILGVRLATVVPRTTYTLKVEMVKPKMTKVVNSWYHSE